MRGGQSLAEIAPKRVSRACQYCRRRKIRCNGKSRCGSCIDFGLECSYEYSAKPIRRTERTLVKEESFDEAEGRLTLSPASNYGSRSPSAGIASRSKATTPEDGRDSAVSMTSDPPSTGVTTPATPPGDCSILETIHAGLDRDFTYPEDSTESRGGSSGIEVLRRIRSLCDLLIGPYGASASSYGIANALDQSFPRHLLPTYSIANVPLPSRPELERLVRVAFSKALRCRPFIDRACIKDILDRLNNGTAYVEEDELTLIYCIAALGQRYESGLQPSTNDSIATGMVNGLGLFGAAQQRINTVHSSLTLTKIQAILCLALYLVSASAKRMAQTYIGMAAQGARRLDEIIPRAHTRDAASRTWTYIVMKEIDLYVSASLGLPRIIPTGEIFIGPADVPDYGSNEDMAIANARNHLFEILGAFLKTYHHGQDFEIRSTYTMSERRIREFDEKLERWEELHSSILRANSPAEASVARLSLQLDKCWAELIAYSPFIHYALRLKSQIAAPELATVMKASQAAVRAIDIAELIRQHTGLGDADPLMLETIAIAAAVLLVIELSVPSGMPFVDARGANVRAHQLLQYLAIRGNTAARGCLESLEPLYARLPVPQHWAG